MISVFEKFKELAKKYNLHYHGNSLYINWKEHNNADFQLTKYVSDTHFSFWPGIARNSSGEIITSFNPIIIVHSLEEVERNIQAFLQNVITFKQAEKLEELKKDFE